VGLPLDLVAVLGKIAGSGAKICLISALSRGASGEMLARICRAGVADHALCADDSPRGFPWPDPVLTAMLRLGAGDVREVAVISATESGLQAGYRAGARIVAGVGEGSRRIAALRQAGATHVVSSIEALPDLVIGGG
jgi:phosphoglycolate phosphatase